MQLDPHILDFLTALDAQGGSPLWTLSPTSAREVLLSVQRSVTVPKLPVDIADCTLLAGPTGRIGLRLVRPQGASGALPGVMYFHGGGWMLGDAETHDRLVCEIATGAQAVVVFVEYARSPQAKYPVATEQAYTATTWVAEQGALIGVDPSPWRLLAMAWEARWLPSPPCWPRNGGATHRVPGPLIPGDGCELRDAIVSGVWSRGVLAHQRDDAVVLGQLCTSSRAQGVHRLAAASFARATQRTPASPHRDLRAGCRARRGRSLCP
jgi:hypothetical protein